MLSIPFENPGAVARADEGAALDRVRVPFVQYPQMELAISSPVA